MHMMLAVRDGKAEFVHARGPRKHAAFVGIEFPGVVNLIEQSQRGLLYARGLFAIDAVAFHQRIDRHITRVLLAGATDHVVQHAFAQRRFARLHALEAEFVERRLQHQRAAGDHRLAILGQTGQVNRVDALERQQFFDQRGERDIGDCALGELHRQQNLGDLLDGAGGTEHVLPAACAIAGDELLELGGNFGQPLAPAFARQLAVAEEAPRAGDATHLQTFALQRLIALADDELGGTAANIDHQPALAGRRAAVGDAEIHQARFLASRHHFNRVPDRGFGRAEELSRMTQLPHAVGGDDAHALRWNRADALTEARQAIDRALEHLLAQATAIVESFGQAHGFAQAIDDAQLTEHVARDHHVEAVGTQVDRGEQFAVAKCAAMFVRAGAHRIGRRIGSVGVCRHGGVSHLSSATQACQLQSLASNAVCAE